MRCKRGSTGSPDDSELYAIPCDAEPHFVPAAVTRRQFLSVKQLFQQRFFAFVRLVVIAGSRLNDRPFSGLGLFQDFIEFTAVEPDPATFGAVVDFDSLAFGENQHGIFAVWTLHLSPPCVVKIPVLVIRVKSINRPRCIVFNKVGGVIMLCQFACFAL